ncbi:hypothetical protein F5Y17DRAFT_456763 [Xylariaceae sp. FL0594]|nr:hypothetical protein F5Y17DRAFT_456763 [Xylariaceae sp. FL0594]
MPGTLGDPPIRQSKSVRIQQGPSQAGSIFTVASFADSAPTLYWTLMEIYSRPGLLAEVRRDLEARKGTRQGNSCFRKVLADTVLDGKYLLKKSTP